MYPKMYPIMYQKMNQKYSKTCLVNLNSNWQFTINDRKYKKGPNNHDRGTRKLIYWKLQLFGTVEPPPNL